MPDSQDDNHLIPLHPSPEEGLMVLFTHRLRNLMSYRFLIRKRIKTNISNTYKRSFIGVSWLVITPILSVVIWVILHGAGIISPGETGVAYPAYVLLSTSIWSFFIGAYQASSNAFLSYGPLMIAQSFPHEVIVVEKIIVHVVNFLIPFCINIIVLIVYNVSFTWQSLLFPLALIPLFLLGIGIGMIVALLRVVAVDLAKMADQAISFLMFLTPVIYAGSADLGGLGKFVGYNPLTYLLGLPRDLLIYGHSAHLTIYLYCAFGSVVVFLLSTLFYIKNEKQLLERIINV